MKFIDTGTLVRLAVVIPRKYFFFILAITIAHAGVTMSVCIYYSVLIEREPRLVRGDETKDSEKCDQGTGASRESAGRFRKRARNAEKRSCKIEERSARKWHP